jgi:hypothetical protein
MYNMRVPLIIWEHFGDMLDLNRNGKDDFIEIADGILGAVEQAGSWLRGEVAGLLPATQDIFTGALNQAKGPPGTAKPIGEVVADTLTILYNEGHDLFVGAEDVVKAEAKTIKSSVIEAAAGLTLQPVPK